MEAEQVLSDLSGLELDSIVLWLVPPECDGLLLNACGLLTLQVDGSHHRSGEINKLSDNGKLSGRSVVLRRDFGDDRAR